MRAHNAPDDRRIAELAARQHGVVAYRELTAMGFGRGAVQRRVVGGRLHALHRGVYAVGHPRLPIHGRWMAAVLACGPGAVLSHRCAASMLALLPYSGRRLEVATTRRCRRPGIVVHRVRRLPDDDRALVDSIPVTSVARTLCDLAGAVRTDQLRRAIEAAERQGVFDLRSFEHRRVPPALRDELAGYFDHGFTRSDMERDFVRLCRDAGLPPPSMNRWVDDQEVDAVWEDEQLAVQLDSWEFHRTRAAFESDRRRQAALQLRGYRVLPVTYRWLEDDPAGVATAVRSLLAKA